jgi:hypothetical protein
MAGVTTTPLQNPEPATDPPGFYAGISRVMEPNSNVSTCGPMVTDYSNKIV